MELLKALIAFGGRDVPESKLADALWPEAEGDAAAQALTTNLFRLRKLIGNNTVNRKGGRLTLDHKYCWVDCWALERLLGDKVNEPEARLAKLKKFYQSPFLNSEDAPWAVEMRDGLHGKISAGLDSVYSEPRD